MSNSENGQGGQEQGRVVVVVIQDGQKNSYGSPFSPDEYDSVNLGS